MEGTGKLFQEVGRQTRMLRIRGGDSIPDSPDVLRVSLVAALKREPGVAPGVRYKRQQPVRGNIGIQQVRGQVLHHIARH